MNKPNGYDEARAAGEFIPVDLGGHYAVVKQVAEKQSSTGKDMIVVLFDFCAPDKQPNYFSKMFENDDRPDKKWPFAGSKYIMVLDYNDGSKTSRQFKTFCTCVEKSNNYTIKWGGKDWAAQFKNKKIGIVFGEEEQEYEGKITTRRVPKWFCSFDSALDQKIPEKKFLENVPLQQAPPQTQDSFINIPEGVDEEIPF